MTRLLPVQAWALWEAGVCGGLLAPVGVGGGKTALDVLVPLVVPDCRVAVLLLPPARVGQFTADYLALREHFDVPSLVLPGAEGGWVSPGRPVLHVVPYSRLSGAAATDLLDRLQPDLIVADEAHKLKDRKSARTRRVLRYLSEPAAGSCRLCAWSGTITSRSIGDFAHLAAFALGEGSPLPLDPDEVARWAAAVDPSDWPAPAGALHHLGAGSAREVVAERCRSTVGFVVSPGGDGVGATIVLRERAARLPPRIVEMSAELRRTWVRPDGEELVDALSVAACARQLACGFYYRWRFPGSPPTALVEEWFAARRAWNREVRETLRSPQPHLDSPLLVANAAERARVGYAGPLPVLESDAWPRWREMRDQVEHETEAVWVDDYLARDAVAWASDHRGIVWYESAALGAAVAKIGGLPLIGGGETDPAGRARASGSSVVMSLRAHGEGLDGLQHLYAEQLAAEPPAGADAWEQLLGRLHRRGQAADEVVTHAYRHAPELSDAVDRALDYALYVEGVTGAHQKLLAADREWERARPSGSLGRKAA